MSRIFLILLVTVLSPVAVYAAGAIKSIDSGDILRLLDDNTKIKCLVVAASWCSDCTEKIKGLEKLKNRDTVSTIIISIDQNIKKAGKIPSHLPVYYISTNRHQLPDILQQSNIQFDGKIPYMVLMDYDNYIVAEGNFSINSIQEGISTLIR